VIVLAYILVVRGGEEALDYLFCRAALPKEVSISSQTGFAGFETTQSRWSASAQAIEE